jgi:hypothetical protein
VVQPILAYLETLRLESARRRSKAETSFLATVEHKMEAPGHVIEASIQMVMGAVAVTSVGLQMQAVKVVAHLMLLGAVAIVKPQLLGAAALVRPH